MISLLDKIKTLIEYAKLGLFFCAHSRGENAEFYFPRGYKETVEWQWNSGYNMYATKISGHVKGIGGNSLLSANKPIVEIDLPECISFWQNPAGDINTTLKIIKLPSFRSIGNGCFKNLAALEYLELGAVTSFDTNALQGSINVKEIYVKEGTTSSLYLYPCPNITQECLHKIIENYAAMTGAAAPTFHVGEENLAKIDNEHIAMLNTKNINYK
jgi:hypothetical protein